MYLLHVSEDIHTTTEEILSLLAVQLVDKLSRVVLICLLVPTTLPCGAVKSIAIKLTC